MSEELPNYYWGRHWDAPMTDGAVLMHVEFADAMFNGEVEQNCTWCKERMTLDDDLFVTPHSHGHMECFLRPMGDVQHLEGRCLCSRGTGNEITYESDHFDTYRESAKATVQWLVDHNRGRWHD